MFKPLLPNTSLSVVNITHRLKNIAVTWYCKLVETMHTCALATAPLLIYISCWPRYTLKVQTAMKYINLYL